MRKSVLVLVTVALIVGLGSGTSAQVYPENHYLVYQLSNQDQFMGQVTLWDQFNQFFPDPYTTNSLLTDKFANPVMKNGEDYFEPFIHQTWWDIFDPQPTKEVWLLNQFGEQTWQVFDGRYLVLPAVKNQDQGFQIPVWNHYKCYDASGPPVDADVNLTDQWGSYISMAVEPVLFCNPCIKELADGTRYEIVQNVHLAVYRLEPPIMHPMMNTAVVEDQFLFRGIETDLAIWLVVPSDKLAVVDNEKKSWGSIKSLFR